MQIAAGLCTPKRTLSVLPLHLYLLMDLSSSRLIFRRGAQKQTQTLVIANTDYSRSLAYKVKTTRSSPFTVCPNASTIGPGGELEVQITRISSEGNSETETCGETLLVMGSLIDAWLTENPIHELWRELENSNSYEIARVRVVYKSSESDRARVVSPLPVCSSMNLSTSELIFQHGIQEQTQTLVIANTDFSRTLAYKVKTTKPELFTVRPNASTISPGERLEVQISRISRWGNNKTETSKEKFLILGSLIDDRLTENPIHVLWRDLEKSGNYQAAKVRVVYG